MYCSSCGKENNKDNKFCSYCGKKINYSPKVNSNGNKETSLVLGILCICSSLFLNILCFIPGIISIIYANKYKKESGKLGAGFGLSIGGMVISVIILLLIILFFWFLIDVTKDYNYIDSIETIRDNYGLSNM